VGLFSLRNKHGWLFCFDCCTGGIMAFIQRLSIFALLFFAINVHAKSIWFENQTTYTHYSSFENACQAITQSVTDSYGGDFVATFLSASPYAGDTSPHIEYTRICKYQLDSASQNYHAVTTADDAKKYFDCGTQPKILFTQAEYNACTDPTPELTPEQQAAADAAAAAAKAAEQKAADDAKAAQAKADAAAKAAQDKADAAAAAADAKSKSDAAAAAAAAAKAAQDKADADAAAAAADENNASATPEQKASSAAASSASSAAAATSAAAAAASAADAAAAVGAAAAAMKDEQQPEFCEIHPSSIICKNSSINAGYCNVGKSTGFTCDGDAIQCAIAKEQQAANCKFYETDDSLTAKYNEALNDNLANNPSLPQNAHEINLPTSLDASSPYAGQCNPDLVIAFNGDSITIPFSKWCDILASLGYLFLAMAYMSAAYILGGAL
jgi:hypothetical protein